MIVAELSKVKAINPNVSAVFYYNRCVTCALLLNPTECVPTNCNSVLDFPQYQLHERTLNDPSLLLHDASGDIIKFSCPAPTKTCGVFDFGNPKTRELFIEECINATARGADGCFVDRPIDVDPGEVVPRAM